MIDWKTKMKMTVKMSLKWKYASRNKTRLVKQDVEYKWVILNYEAKDMKIIKDESKRKGKKS